MSKKNGIKAIEDNTIVIDDVDNFVGSLKEAAAAASTEPISIKKAKIVDDLFLAGEYEIIHGDTPGKFKFDCDEPVHDDLKAAFRKLDDHLSRLCHQFNNLGHLDTFNVNCKAISIGGNGDSEGVNLIGYRGFDDGKSLNLVSPFTKWTDEYEYISELAGIIEECKYEVMQYVFEGKHQPTAQQELAFPKDEFSEPGR